MNTATYRPTRPYLPIGARVWFVADSGYVDDAVMGVVFEDAPVDPYDDQPNREFRSIMWPDEGADLVSIDNLIEVP
jgi:hypothetical protein